MKIITVGDNCIDYYIQEGIGYPGGNPVNVAVYIQRMNERSSYMGIVGNDQFGKLIIDCLNKKGVDISNVEIVEGNTAITMVSFENQERILGDYIEGVLENFQLDQSQIDIINTYDLMVTGIWSKVEDQLDQITIPIAFDFADKYDSPLFWKSIHQVDYAFYSDDLRDEKEIQDIIQKIYGGRNKIIVVTRGSKGSIAYDGHLFYQYGIIDCNVVDTLGAGDSFIAGFLVCLLQGKSILECMENGARNASITIGYKGAW